MEMKAGWEQRTIRNDGEVSALLKEAPTFCRPCKQFSSQHNCDCVFVNLLRLCFCDCALISNWSFCQLSEDLVLLFTVVALDLHWLNIFSMFSSKHYLDKVESLCLNTRLPLPLKVAKTFDIVVWLHRIALADECQTMAELLPSMANCGVGLSCNWTVIASGTDSFQLVAELTMSNADQMQCLCFVICGKLLLVIVSKIKHQSHDNKLYQMCFCLFWLAVSWKGELWIPLVLDVLCICLMRQRSCLSMSVCT